MKIIKNINNNYAIALDNDGTQLVVSGKGIGFGSTPREITDLKSINRTYYNLDTIYYSMINDLSGDIIELSTLIIDKANKELNTVLSANIVFTLADHLNFAIQRTKQNLNIKLPIAYDIKNLFEEEYQLGKYGLKLIREKLNIYLPDEEASYIAMHIINAETRLKESIKTNDNIIHDITRMIEQELNIKIIKDDFNYSRFVTHMHYLLKRVESKRSVSSANHDLYEIQKNEHTKTYQCVEKISEYLLAKLNVSLSKEENLYLILHINRLCDIKVRNQQGGNLA